jgi:hypothetical protein
VKAKLTQLSTQDLCWVPDAYSILGRNEHRDNLHCITSQWFRPNLLCCHQHDHHHRSTLLPESSMASDVYLEPVIQVHLLGHITLLAGEEAGDSPYLKFAEHLWPHSSSQDLPPVVGGSATETIGGEVDTKHDLLHYANISYEQLGEIILPHAVDRLRENVTATSYKVLWRSKHGRAYLHAEKTSWGANARKDDMGSRLRQNKKKQKVLAWTSGRTNEFRCSWMAYAPAQLQASAVDWVRKQERVAAGMPLPLFPKTISSCTHDCPVMPLPLRDLKSLAKRIKSFSTGS